MPHGFSLTTKPTRFMFFTGKGGVGKTTISCAVATALADQGKKVLLVSTDPASNLDEMLSTKLDNSARPVANVTNLFALNIDPESAADEYRQRVLEQMDDAATDLERSTVKEQLSGACTTEIAAFDEFAGLLTGESVAYDHVIFDTAPTGHTLRLLSLPKAWTGFLEDNDRGASCLGPHSGLKIQEDRFQAAFKSLVDANLTSIVLVTRPESAAIREAARTSEELGKLGLGNLRIVINGVFKASDQTDGVARSFQEQGELALAQMPEALKALPQDKIPLKTFDMVGLGALRRVLNPEPDVSPPAKLVGADALVSAPNLAKLVTSIAEVGHALIMVMGKGGVGKTTIASAIAVGLVERGHSVHLTTTDPAAHVTSTLQGDVPGLIVDRIDPKAETQRYIDRIMATRGAKLDAESLALLREDLESPCTEEVAVFHAFSRVVAEARSSFVVLDTAPTGHTLLLLDATGAYHRQVTKDALPSSKGRMVTPLMRLQDPQYSKVIIVTLPETTPVSEAASLQDDLRRAKIEPYAWIVNRSLIGSHTHDPILAARLPGELAQIKRVNTGLAKRLFLVPWQETTPVGHEALRRMADG